MSAGEFAGCAAAGLAGRESEVMKRAFPFFVAVLAVACAVTFAFGLFGMHAHFEAGRILGGAR